MVRALDKSYFGGQPTLDEWILDAARAIPFGFYGASSGTLDRLFERVPGALAEVIVLLCVLIALLPANAGELEND